MHREYQKYHRYKYTRIKKLHPKNQILNRIPEHRHRRGRLTRHEHYHSRALDNSRHIDIYLPPSYGSHPERRYPVVYMHDGNNLFDPRIAFAGVPWRVDKVLDRLITHNLIEEVIVIGIHNTMGRNEEYTWHPMRMSGGYVEGGRGEKYAHFLVEELKPFIDFKYQTLGDPEHTAVIGSSLGGLISFYLGLYYPYVFTKIGIISPSLWWGYGRVFRDMDIHYLNRDLQIWLDMGTREGGSHMRVKENPNVRAVRILKEKLIRHGYVEGVNLGYLEDRGGRHNEYAWGQRFHLPLMFFFGKQPHLIRVRK